MSQQYKVIFINASQNDWDFCLYQQDPSLSTNPNIMALAWFAQQVDRGTDTTYQWGVDYSFVWSQTGLLANGAVLFSATETVPADLSMANQIPFTYNGAFTFGAPSQDPQRGGSLVIEEDGTIPMGEAYVGIGMAGNGTFAVPAKPNLTLTFTPKPEYWCTFGTYEVGQVMDIGEIAEPQQIVFDGYTTATVTLTPANTWEVTYSN